MRQSLNTKDKHLKAISYQLSAPFGVTIIELVVVLAVIGIMTSFTLANYQVQQRQHSITGQAHIFASAVRQAQLFAYTGRLDASTRPRAYGVHITSGSQYVVFADDTTLGTAFRYDTVSDTIVETFTLPGGVTLDVIGNDISYAVPKGPVYLNGVAPGSDMALTITDAASGLHVSVAIDGVSGQVDIQ